MKKSLFEHRLGSRQATTRLAALLLLITLSIVASKLAEDHFIDTLRKDCESLFSDRLIPATTLFQLSDAIYQRRDLLERFLHGDPSIEADEFHRRLGENQASVDHLVSSIEETYLVDDESRLLRELRKSLDEYGQVESQLILERNQGKHASGTRKLQPAFDELRQELLKLTRVQESVGQELKTESLASATSVTTLLYIQLGIAFSLGSLAAGLAMSMRPRNREEAPPKREDMH